MARDKKQPASTPTRWPIPAWKDAAAKDLVERHGLRINVREKQLVHPGHDAGRSGRSRSRRLWRLAPAGRSRRAKETIKHQQRHGASPHPGAEPLFDPRRGPCL